MRKKILLYITIGLFIFLIGCSEDTAMEPVPINEGVDSCETCHMGIIDMDASSQIILQDGTPKKFDDIGCMLAYYQENKENVGKAYVHDFHSKEWIDLEEATFLQDSSFESPMSYGMIAFNSSEDADTFQADNGGEKYVGTDVTDIDLSTLKAMGHGESEHHE